MATFLRSTGPLLLFAAVSGAAADNPAPALKAVDFNREVRPILADKCFHCHGPDDASRQAELRLDEPVDPKREANGRKILDPGKPKASELYRRITCGDESDRMPPVDQARQLTASEIETIRKWIEQGAPFGRHWSFLPLARPALPVLKGPRSPNNPIDLFVFHRLEQDRLSPMAEADKHTLVRRLTLDLTGLPPTPAEVEAFLLHKSPDSYERLLDRLLASPAYGEQAALGWLDAARFADSGGYQGDILRDMSAWRDWVIDAFNQNLPFDQFTIEQLAGDLLPAATIEQRIASGFNRNHRINDEDGIIFEEFRVEYVADRVETTSTVWLGLTVGCARCHDHKYDPLRQEEYYKLFAYFNSSTDQGRGHGNAPPLLPLISLALRDQIAAVDKQIASLQQTGDQAAALQKLNEEKQKLLAAAPNTMIMQELDKPRETFVLTRGAYDRPGKRVEPGTPAALHPLPAGVPTNRLGLSRWLLDPANPLTARVVVNGIWQQFFGVGLVATTEDFGIQGEPPTHPELLDWLANEFIRSGWDVKGLKRLIVTSATYRQSSAAPAEHYARDPANRLLGRAPRFRLAAELIRDQALAASGVIDRRIGGPSVRPYQPPELWKELTSASTDYEQSHGRDLYRRSLYTFIRRTVSPPAMANFDAPNRELCAVRRPRTNTPVQALTLMNDPTFLEAARVFAARLVTEPADDAARLRTVALSFLARPFTEREQSVFRNLLVAYRSRFLADIPAAKAVLSVGEYPRADHVNPAEQAAWTALTSAVMNLDEAITKE